MMEALFGDQKLSSIGRRRTPDDPSGTIVPRTLLPWTVISSPHTDMVSFDIADHAAARTTVYTY